MNDMASSLRLTLGYTLVDITKTGEVSGQVDSKARNQQRNWETLVQVLGLRAQLVSLSDPESVDADVCRMQFGPDFSGNQRVWVFRFGVEQEGVFDSPGHKYGSLEGDLITVPIILGLDETADIRLPTFTVSGLQRNIYFEPFMI
jgi:hypothetical protein